MISREVDFLVQLFNGAVAKAHPAECLPPYLPDPPPGRTVVIGAGKAAASMAHAVAQNWTANLSGLVVTRYGHAVDCKRIEVLQAAHPVPDETGTRAAQRMLDMVSHLTTDDMVLALISGGGSSLLTLPAPGVSLRDKQDISRALLKSGANIADMNCVRKHLSAIKGGRLAAHCAPAVVTGLTISDVPGDDPSTIASGPTVADATTRQEALAVLKRFNISPSPALRHHLESAQSETPKPGDPIFSRVSNKIIATAAASLEAARARAEQQGIEATMLGDNLEGEARVLGKHHAELAMNGSRAAPSLLISGGETTVTVTGTGRGGRNVEYLLGMAIALNGAPEIYALAADTDGIDGTEDNAGAVITPTTLSRARSQNLDAKAYLNNNDAYGFFEQLGDLLTTGPTLTNVNDFRAIYLA